MPRHFLLAEAGGVLGPALDCSTGRMMCDALVVAMVALEHPTEQRPGRVSQCALLELLDGRDGVRVQILDSASTLLIALAGREYASAPIRRPRCVICSQSMATASPMRSKASDITNSKAASLAPAVVSVRWAALAIMDNLVAAEAPSLTSAPALALPS